MSLLNISVMFLAHHAQVMLLVPPRFEIVVRIRSPWYICDHHVFFIVSWVVDGLDGSLVATTCNEIS